MLTHLVRADGLWIQGVRSWLDNRNDPMIKATHSEQIEILDYLRRLADWLHMRYIPPTGARSSVG